jgi:mevalonate kinase
MSSASAPGKIILFGEHAVVYGQPALAVPVTQVQAEVQITGTSTPDVWIDAPDIQLQTRLDQLELTNPIAATIRNTLDALNLPPLSGVTIQIHSTIPVASGLGSGAAVSVALIRALASYTGKILTGEQVNGLAYKTEKLHHGTPSGIDNTVITYARPVYFVRDRPITSLQVKKPFTIVIGDTGISAATMQSVRDVRQSWQKNPAHFESLFSAIGSIVRTARQSLERGSPDLLGPLMRENHILLQELRVSSPELDRLVEAAQIAGALGAKLSGGGRGGNMIAIARSGEAEAVAASLHKAGARNTIITEID